MEVLSKALVTAFSVIFCINSSNTSRVVNNPEVMQKPDVRSWYEGHLQSSDYIPVQSWNSKEVIYSPVTIDIDYNYEWPKGKGKCYASAAFYRKSSKICINCNIPDLDYLLRHEQGHFDLAEYETRLVNNRIIDVTDWKTVNKICLQHINQLDSLSRWYDIETDYSNNKVQQAKWRRKIDDLMNSLTGTK